MQVYGDAERSELAHAVAAEIGDRVAQCQAMPPGLHRHQALVAAFIRASELVQGVADAEFAAAGADDVSEWQDGGGALLLMLAKAIAASWTSGFTASTAIEPLFPYLELLSGAGAIRTRQAEGYAFYALYPEAYIAAAQQSGLGSDTTVIGIRSIGVGLAAIVAEALGAAVMHSVRPTGHPFDRRLAIGEGLAARLLNGAGNYAIVDEGPGLSGSSFNCVADWLVAHGVAEHRIHFFPSHTGELGSAARVDHRRRWLTAPKHVVRFEQLILDAHCPHQRLENWIAASAGPLASPLQDLSGGAWRALRSEAREDWPPADPAMEKRKFLAVAGGRRWLAKFVGIGKSGEARLELARKLAAAGFAPEPLALCHGFLITPWLEAQGGQRELPPADRVLDYLALRACLPANGPGAALPDLFDMAAYNLGRHLGETAARAVKAALGDPHRFQPVPCCTDSRMHDWEWVNAADGWQKLDGLDHHAAHDLVGCQDVAWDVAGAAVELGLAENERDRLAAALAARIGRPVSLNLVAASELCYLGFQIGLWTMARARNDEAEHRAIDRLLARYGRRAQIILACRA